MYNRYIPQNDGSFRRRQIQDPAAHLKPPAPPPENDTPPPPPRKPPEPQIRSFLRHLLPKEFDTGDLIIVLLLLLMAGDCQEEQNTALLTLALYFFM